MSKPALWTKNFIALSLINFMTFFGFQMLTPIFPLYLADLNIEKDLAGMVMAVFSLAVVPMRLVAGRWLDMGLSRFCMIFGIVVCTVATGAFWITATAVTVAIARFVQGMGFGVSTVTFGTIVSRIIPAERRAEGVGYFSLSLSLAMCMGPWMGPALYVDYGIGGVLLFSCLCGILALPMIKMLHVEDVVVEKTPLGLGSLFEKSVRFPSFLYLLVGVSWASIIGYVALWAQELNVHDIGSFFLVNAIFTFLVRTITGKAADRFGFSYVIIPSVLLFTIGLYLLGIASSRTNLLVCAAFIGTGMGSLMPIFQAWVINQAPSSRRSAAMAMYYNAFDVGIALGLVCFGTLVQKQGYQVTYHIAAGIMGLLFVLYVIYLIIYRNAPKHGQKSIDRIQKA